MFPILNIGPAAIQLPGLILLLGYWLSLNLAGRRARSEGLPEDAILNAGFVALLAGLLGARLGYVTLHWSAYQDDLSGVVALTFGALSTPVGILTATAAAALFLRRYRLPVPILLDALAPALALLLAFMSFAELSSGSAYGTVSDLPWAIELWGARRHPTQIYELLAALATLGLLWCVRTRRPYAGFLALLFLLAFGASRLFLDAFRADPWLLPGGYRGMQVVGLVLVVACLWTMSRQAVRTHNTMDGLLSS
jgi:phosphatidylglycerol:prolipoprotein diacylglycerol transferase